MMETRLPGHYEWRLGANSGHSPAEWQWVKSTRSDYGLASATDNLCQHPQRPTNKVHVNKRRRGSPFRNGVEIAPVSPKRHITFTEAPHISRDFTRANLIGGSAAYDQSHAEIDAHEDAVFRDLLTRMMEDRTNISR